MMLNDWNQSKEEYEGRLAEAAAERKAREVARSRNARRPGFYQRVMVLLRNL